MPRTPLADTLVPLSDLGVETRLGVPAGDGWVGAARLVEDDEELRVALAEIAGNLGTATTSAPPS